MKGKNHLQIVCSNTKNLKYNRFELKKCEGGVATMYTISKYTCYHTLDKYQTNYS